jgi:hypothetical protein
MFRGVLNTKNHLWSILNEKWSSQKFEDEQINEKFGVAFSDGDICIFCYNINVGSISSQPY